MNRDMMPDGLHPNEEGYRAWGKAMEPTKLVVGGTIGPVPEGHHG